MSKDKPTRKENPLTPSMILFAGKQILTERPPSMNYAEYYFLRRHQTQLLKKLHRKASNNNILEKMGTRLGYNRH